MVGWEGWEEKGGEEKKERIKQKKKKKKHEEETPLHSIPCNECRRETQNEI